MLQVEHNLLKRGRPAMLSIVHLASVLDFMSGRPQDKVISQSSKEFQGFLRHVSEDCFKACIYHHYNTKTPVRSPMEGAGGGKARPNKTMTEISLLGSLGSLAASAPPTPGQGFGQYLDRGLGRCLGQGLTRLHWPFKGLIRPLRAL